MSRQRVIVLTGAAAAIAAVAVVGFAAAGQADGDRRGTGDPAGPVVHKVQEDPQKVQQYWTEERMRDARPAPMPQIGTD